MEIFELLIDLILLALLCYDLYLGIQISRSDKHEEKPEPVEEAPKKKPSKFDQGVENIFSYMPGKRDGDGN